MNSIKKRIATFTGLEPVKIGVNIMEVGKKKRWEKQ